MAIGVRVLLFLLFYVSTGCASAQNLVINGGFEVFRGPVPCSYIINPANFTLNGWSIPTKTTPDIYSSFVEPACATYAGPGSYDDVKPFRGLSMVGIFTYGTSPKVGEWREYVQAELFMPMIPGKKYAVEFWVRIKPTSPKATGNFGVYFSETEIRTDQFTRLAMSPQIEHKPVVSAPRWIQITDTFEAVKPYRYMTIGNFRSDQETANAPHNARNAHENDILYSLKNRAYYYIDHVSVTPIDPDVAEYVRNQEQRRNMMTQVHFEHDQYDLAPEMRARLDDLLEYMKSLPNARIMLAGHTDSVGNEDYNMQLSEMRAQEVRKYLLKKNFPANRILAKWFGPHKPAASNATPEGRYANRRVNLEIIQ